MSNILPSGFFPSDLMHQVEGVIESGRKMGGVCICTSGEADYLINGHSYHLTKGCAFIVSPIIISSPITVSNDFELLDLSADISTLVPVFTKIVKAIITLNIPDNPCHQLTDEEYAMMLEGSAKISEYKQLYIAEKNEARRIVLHTLLENKYQGIMLMLLEKFSSRILSRETDDQERKTADISHEFFISLYLNYKKEHSVQFYANSLGYSPGYFTSLIRKSTGKTPSEIIAIRLITEAKTMLDHTKLSIKQIAMELGFPEQFTFRKFFKLHVGVSPKEYRQKQ